MIRPRVVLLGAGGTLAGLDGALGTLGIDLTTYPILAFEEPTDWLPVDRAIARLSEFSAVAVTSPRAGAAFARRCEARSARLASAPPVWATGAASAAALRAIGFRCLPGTRGHAIEGAARQLADRMIEAGVGSPVLFPCGERRRPELVDRLTAAGVAIEPVICYRTNVAQPGRAREILPGAAAVIVTSPGAVEALGTALGGPRPDMPVVTLGVTTLEAALEAGWLSASAAPSATPAGVAEWLDVILGHPLTSR